MSYLDYFCKNYKDVNPQDEEKIKGSCYSMCPAEEKSLRVREKMIHILELVGTEKKLVKCYSRSAADSNMALPQQLRPYHILRSTVIYLLFEVTKQKDVPLPIVYDFINDRLRAVRQDMTIQRLSLNQCTSLLEPMIRFYVFYGYKLHGLPLKDFNPILHKKYLAECLKWFLSCCDSGDAQCVSGEDNNLSAALATLELGKGMALPCDRPLMESLYLLCNLNDMHTLYRYVCLPKELKMHPTLRLSYSIAVANMHGNFVRVTRLLRKLSPLLHCALCQQLPEIQRRSIFVLASAYNSATLAVPVAALAAWAALPGGGGGGAAAARVAEHYGMAARGGDVVFSKTRLRVDAPMHQSEIQTLHDGKLDLTLENVLTYTV